MPPELIYWARENASFGLGRVSVTWYTVFANLSVTNISALLERKYQAGPDTHHGVVAALEPHF